MNALTQTLTPARTVYNAPGISKKWLFVLALPTAGHQQYLDILSTVARPSKHAAFCEGLRSTKDDRALYDIACSAAT